MWLLSERAVRVLMERCGWEASGFGGGTARRYELYAEFGLALGKSPTAQDAAVNALTCAVVPLPEAQFYHFGTNGQMIESVAALQNLVLDEAKVGRTGARQQPDQVTQNSRFDVALRREGNHTLWVENSVVPSGWQLASQHVLTGVPENDWTLRLHRRRVPRLRADWPGPVLRAGLRFQRRLRRPAGRRRHPLAGPPGARLVRRARPQAGRLRH